jgi:8-oxo-dGTP pyrophosphatase MutT (NUDIX family)
MVYNRCMKHDSLTIRDAFKSSKGDNWDIVYREIENFDEIRHLPLKSVGGISIYNEKMVLVFAKKRLSWEMPGGGMEKGESIEEAFKRELKEEANMEALQIFPLGYDTLTNRSTGMNIYQVRVACIAKPFGEFVKDPDGDITEIQLIEPKEYKRFFNWGKRSDVMVEKALRIIQSHK